MMPAGVHADAAAARLMNAFGITDLDLAERLMTQIINTTHLAAVGRTDLRGDPERRPGRGDGHRAAGRSRGDAGGPDGRGSLACDGSAAARPDSISPRPAQRQIGNLAIKLLRTYTAQLEALKRYRSAGEQRVVVQHQHVNVTADQAAVQVNGGGYPGSRGEGGGIETGGTSPCARSTAIRAFEPEHPVAMPGPGGERHAGSRQ